MPAVIFLRCNNLKSLCLFFSDLSHSCFFFFFFSFFLTSNTCKLDCRDASAIISIIFNDGKVIFKRCLIIAEFQSCWPINFFFSCHFAVCLFFYSLLEIIMNDMTVYLFLCFSDHNLLYLSRYMWILSWFKCLTWKYASKRPINYFSILLLEQHSKICKY